ncbi:MAG: hypothetical protein QOK40_2046 [Miltoncostaeaceae bacterium]|jgi:plastocyanin|nr:hypothetical protein [Miltoncostaeaceae bacterium]
MRLVPSRRGTLGIVALAALAALPAVAQGAVAKVTVAGFVKSQNADLQSYYPTRTTIHVGDSVKFVFQGFHTVTFPANKRVPPILPSRTTNPATNDAAGAPFWWGGTTPQLMANPKVFGPVGRGVETGTQFLNSGVPGGPAAFSYTVKFPKAGTFKYGCGLHPNMTGVVTVVPKKAAVPSAADRVALGKAEETADRATVTSLNKTGAARPATSMTITVAPGTNRATLFRFYPRRATVPAGSVVTFKLSGRNEVHTVSFGSGPVFQQVGQTFGGEPPTFLFGPMPTYATQPPAAGIPSVTPTAHGNGYVSSGLLSDTDIPGLPHTFKVRFPTPGTYQYICFIHEDMGAIIVVT